MKRLVIAAAALTMTLAACGNKNSGSSGTSESAGTIPSAEEIIMETEERTTASEATSEAPATEPATPEPETEPETESPTEPRIPDDSELVRMKDYIPNLYVDLRYATENNFTGKVIYDSGEAYLCYATVKKLIAVQEELNAKGLSLLVWDAYRPVEAQQKLWEVCPNPTYVADPRNGITSHSRGNTVDIGVVGLDGGYVDVPTDFDEFSSLADRDYSEIPAPAAENAITLENIMKAHNFSAYWGEWWHFTDLDFAGIN